jgi:hypothetical protein
MFLVLASTGCSLLIDTDPYLGVGRDAGPRDGSTDAMVDPDAPSAPAVHVEPSAPTTLDDLSVVIDTESVDPLAAGAVTYEYRWLRDGSDASVTVDTVASADTAKGELWRVEVRPVSADGTRRGAPGTAEVTIGNSAPVLLTVGLRQYFPVVGERVSAVPGPARDADGDTVSIRYQWYVDDAAVSGATMSAFIASGLSGGEELRVEAWGFDGDVEGPRVTVGPVSVATDSTTWRQILPDATGRQAETIVYDAPHDRYLRYVEGALWEYVASGDRVTVARLPLFGSLPPDERSDVFHDPVNRRLIVVPESTRMAGFALDLRNRGRETWAPLAIGGSEGPVRRVASAVWVDETTSRLWAYGGLGTPLGLDTPSNELWSLDLTPGSEAWTRHDLSGSVVPALLAPTLAADPSRPGSVVLAGGVALGGGVPVTSASLYRFDLSSSPVVAEELSLRLPTAVYGGVSVTVADRILILGGADAFGPTGVLVGALSVDIAGGSVAAGAAPSVPVGLSGAAHVNPSATDRISYWAGGPRIVDVLLSDLAPELRAELVRPPALSHAMAANTNINRILLHSGVGIVDSPEPVSDRVWELDPASDTWRERTIAGDSITGSGPDPRWGVVTQATTERNSIFFGGVRQDGSLAAPEVWELREAEGRWLLKSLASGETPPEGREGVAVVGGGLCGGLAMYYAGGRRLDGTALGDSGVLSCTVGDRMRDCVWEAAAVAPSARSYAAMGATSTSLWLFGGLTAGGASAQLFVTDPCGGPLSWATVTATGMTPIARLGHSMTYIRPVASELPSFLVFGGASSEAVEDRLGDLARLVVTSMSTARWETVDHTSPSVPKPRAHHVAVWDAVARRLLVYGGVGLDEYEARGDLWELRVR